MIALVHNILPPYRVSLFNAISEQLSGEFRVFLVRENHPGRRMWSVPWDDVAFDHETLPGWSLDRFGQHLDLSSGVVDALDRLDPAAVVVAGWDLNASWTAVAWARRRNRPVVAWVESWRRSGRYRGSASNTLRRRFLSRCSAALVPGAQAAQFVRDLVPGLPVIEMPNSVDATALRSLPDPELGGRALFIGELTKRKGADVLLAGRHRVFDHFDSLAFAGTGPLGSELKATAARDRRLEPVGYVEDEAMVDLVASSSAVLLPSRADPWPLVPVEALVAGRPVLLGPGVGSAPDLIKLEGGVVTMPDLRLRTLAERLPVLAAERVPESARGLFTAEDSAARFVAAADLALSE